MVNLSELLAERGIQKAVVIDDVYDQTPQVADIDPELWSSFFDDLSDEDHELLSEKYTDYKTTHIGDLEQLNPFVEVLWQNKDSLSPNAVNSIFSDFEQRKTVELARLESFVVFLRELGLECITMGRKLTDDYKQADLLFIDLFLGSQQNDQIVDIAIEKLKHIYSESKLKTPIVVLMSSSSRLSDMRNKIRDDAGLISSAFRVAQKSELEDLKVLKRLLTRLASHHEEAILISSFIRSWEKGLDDAKKKFLKIVRRLDLPEIAQIKTLLLDSEGEAIGDYLLDIFDGVLQHETEAIPETISSAKNLNGIDTTNCPAPHLDGTSDLQVLAHKMMFQHHDRLTLSDINGKIHPHFGDLLRWKSEVDDTFSKKVSLVVTPACDLARKEAESILLVCGKLNPLEPKDWSYGAKPVRTAIVILPDGDRYWIEWDLTSLMGLTFDEFDTLMSNNVCIKRIGRLRETYALEIQQKLIASLGRVGRPAKPPATFPVEVSFYYANNNGEANKLDVDCDGLAVCYTGRESVQHLILHEHLCDALEKAFRNLQPAQISSRAQISFLSLYGDPAFFRRFETGELNIPAPGEGDKPTKGEGDKIYLFVSRGEEMTEGKKLNGKAAKAALLVNIRDINTEI